MNQLHFSFAVQLTIPPSSYPMAARARSSFSLPGQRDQGSGSNKAGHLLTFFFRSIYTERVSERDENRRDRGAFFFSFSANEDE